MRRKHYMPQVKARLEDSQYLPLICTQPKRTM
jgi:hypothetical protein